jgi:broad specificity phosphatase PhoE
VERFRGRAELDLDETGLRQAEATARRLAQWPVSALYSSPLKRTMRTAEALARHLNVAVQTSPGFTDIDFGLWQGLSLEEAAQQDSVVYARWLENPEQVKFPQGESLEEVRARAVAALEDILASHDDETVALVSHKVVCKVLILSVLGLDNSHFWQVEQDVCATNLFEVRDGFMAAARLNDICHLGDAASRVVRP